MNQAIALSSPLGLPYWGSRGGVPWAETLERTVAEAFCGPRSIETEWGTLLAQASASLWSAFEESSTPNWDGYGAAPANLMSAQWAQQLLEVLHGRIATPDISFTPRGNAMLEWAGPSQRMLGVTIGANGEMRYAFRAGKTKLTGIGPLAMRLPGGFVQALAEFHQ